MISKAYTYSIQLSPSVLKNRVKLFKTEFASVMPKQSNIYENFIKTKNFRTQLDLDKRNLINLHKKNKSKQMNNPLDNYYENYYSKSENLEYFLNSTFNIKSELNALISYIISHNLVEIIFKLPSLIHTNFNTINLDLCLDNKYDNEKWIIVSIYTKLDGASASNKLNLLEDELSEKYKDNFLDTILLSVEFE